MAPLLVAGVSLDYEVIFSDLKLAVLLGYLVKVLLLFNIGGLVSLLHRLETEPWKCFVIGISAPALITTANVKIAKSAENGRLEAVMRIIPTRSLFAFSEGYYDQFMRGFFSLNPVNTIAIISKEATNDQATRVAAASQLFAACAIRGLVIPRPPMGEQTLRKRGLTAEGMVVQLKGDQGRFAVILRLGAPEIALEFIEYLQSKGKIPVPRSFPINSANAFNKMSQELAAPYPNAPLGLPNSLVDLLRPDCTID